VASGTPVFPTAQCQTPAFQRLGERAGTLRLPSNAPIIFNGFASADFVFNTPYEFTDRFAGQSDYFSSEITEGEFEETSITACRR